MLQSGLAGLGLFVITLLSGELAGRLAREELAARGSLELARQQAQLNRLVIEEMADGVLVVDRRPARARRQPGGARAAGRPGPEPAGARSTCRISPPGRALPQAVRAGAGRGALARGRARRACWPSAAAHTRTLRMRVRFMRRAAATGGRPIAADDAAAASPSACCCSRTCARCRRASGRRSWRRWAASRPASRTRSATRWRPSRRPMRCCWKTSWRRRSSGWRAWWPTTSSASSASSTT